MKKNSILKRLLNNFKDPYFVIKIWQQICILAFLSGVVLGATFTQNFYVEQVNKVLEDAVKKDGCFGNYLNKYQPEILRNIENVSLILIDNVTNIEHKPDK